LHNNKSNHNLVNITPSPYLTILVTNNIIIRPGLNLKIYLVSTSQN